MSGEKRTLGAAIFADIEDNEYLNKIHEKVLYNYALRLLQLTKKEPLPFDQKEKRDALRFADLLSKSNDPEKANAHKIWAQEIVILLNELHPEDTLINNWYEYVEYGTTNPLTILLQRNGFSRESARFIKENPEYVVKDGSTGKLKLKASLSKCGRTSVENEVEYIRQNIPGIFVDEED